MIYLDSEHQICGIEVPGFGGVTSWYQSFRLWTLGGETLGYNLLGDREHRGDKLLSSSKEWIKEIHWR